MTLYFLDDVFLLNLPLKPAQSIFERLAFLNANFCQRVYTSKPANVALTMIPATLGFKSKIERHLLETAGILRLPGQIRSVQGGYPPC